MILEVPVDPPMLEVRVLVATVRELVVRMLGATRLVTVAFVVVELPTIKLVMVAKVATKEEMKEEVEVLLVAVKLLIVPVVAFNVVTIASVNVEDAATRRVMYASVVVERVTSASLKVDEDAMREII